MFDRADFFDNGHIIQIELRVHKGSNREIDLVQFYQQTSRAHLHNEALNLFRSYFQRNAYGLNLRTPFLESKPMLFQQLGKYFGKVWE